MIQTGTARFVPAGKNWNPAHHDALPLATDKGKEAIKPRAQVGSGARCRRADYEVRYEAKKTRKSAAAVKEGRQEGFNQNAIPIRLSARHTTRQENREPSVTSTNWSGMPIRLGTSSLAPTSDLSLTIQENALRPNSMVPTLKIRWRGVLRFSMVGGANLETIFIP
jgi:hypothetical protein